MSDDGPEYPTYEPRQPDYEPPQTGYEHGAYEPVPFAAPAYSPPAFVPPQQYFGPTRPMPGPLPSGPHAPQSSFTPAPNAGARRTMLTAVIVAALVGGGVGASTVAIVDHNNNNGNSAGLSFSNQQPPAAKVNGTVTAAAAKIGPSVVTINVNSKSEQDTGSGVIIRPDGYILTNNHVIANATAGAATGAAAGTMSVTLADGRVSTATVIGTDVSDDLAVIKVPLTGLSPATFASSSALVVGQTVVAVGAPLGLSDTVTSGIVSNTARPVQTGDTSSNQAVFNAVQTDAAINPGNSGGPLVNLDGNVVGINAAIATDQSSGGLQVPGQQSQAGSIGIGFAIPSDEASRIATELISTGKSTHALLGVSVANVSASQNQTAIGALIKTVSAGGPASKVGLAVGDIVTNLGGQRIDSADALVAAVRAHAPRDSVSLTYQRNGKNSTVTVTLGSDQN
ncbi:MAG: trypsin-like peptidase domain-containing protein [Jatrophihabitantaceae bacterium]